MNRRPAAPTPSATPRRRNVARTSSKITPSYDGPCASRNDALTHETDRGPPVEHRTIVTGLRTIDVGQFLPMAQHHREVVERQITRRGDEQLVGIGEMLTHPRVRRHLRHRVHLRHTQLARQRRRGEPRQTLHRLRQLHHHRRLGTRPVVRGPSPRRHTPMTIGRVRGRLVDALHQQRRGRLDPPAQHLELLRMTAADRPATSSPTPPPTAPCKSMTNTQPEGCDRDNRAGDLRRMRRPVRCRSWRAAFRRRRGRRRTSSPVRRWRRARRCAPSCRAHRRPRRCPGSRSRCRTGG